MKKALIDQLVDEYITAEKDVLCHPSLTSRVLNNIEMNTPVSPAWIKTMVTAGLIASMLTAAAISSSYKDHADNLVLLNDDVTEHIAWYIDENK